MNYKLYLIVICALSGVIFSSCEDSAPELKGPFTVYIEGVTEVTPGITETYYIGDVEGAESFTWSITGPATITGDAVGSSIQVTFESIGEVVLSVTNGTDGGTRIISVEEVGPEIEVTLGGYGKLKSGSTDTVFFTFPAPLSVLGTVTLLSASDSSYYAPGGLAFGSGSLSSLTKIDDSHYYVLYTAGSGDGLPEIFIDTLATTEAYGAVGTDSIYLQFYEVDNTPPVAALTYSALAAKDSSVVTVTATFNEPIDTLAYISFSGAGVAAQTDTLWATSDPLVYTYDYVVNGGGDGTLTVTLDVTDEAGNDLAGVTGSRAFKVDNTAPEVILTSDGGNGTATLNVIVSELITGWYVVAETGTEGPETVDEFLSFGGIASGSLEFETLNDIIPVALSEGNYDVYFVGMDEVGNYSALAMTTVSVE